MANTMTKIATQVVGSGGASGITFSSIPQTFTDIKVVVSGRSNVSATRVYLGLRFNGVSTSSYSNTVVSSGGSSASSGRNYTGNTEIYVAEINGATSTTNLFSNIDIYIPNYTSSNYKSLIADGVYENNITEAFDVLGAGLFLSTSAITSLNVYPGSGNFVQNSTFTLYGINNS